MKNPNQKYLSLFSFLSLFISLSFSLTLFTYILLFSCLSLKFDNDSYDYPYFSYSLDL